MSFDDFCASLGAATPPEGVSAALAALWWDAKGDWKRAHEVAQDDEGHEASRVHAYLHRKEGDLDNARYWYRRAQQPVCQETLDAEWRRIVQDLTR